MVQGECGVKTIAVDSKHDAYAAMTAKSKPVIKEKEQKTSSSKQDNKYGPWGPIFKNKENFVNMHFC